MFRHRFYAPALSDSSFEFQDLLEKALVFWETAFIDKGDRNNYPEKIELIELPDELNSGSWNKKYKERIEHAIEEISRYQIIKERIEKAIQLTRRNEYSLALMNQINELQIYTAKLLLLLEKYDRAASASDKQTAKQEIRKYVNSFTEIRKKYEEVFSKT